MKKTGSRFAACLLSAALLLGCGFAAAASGAPVAENLELTTCRGVSVGGRLSATDPEGDTVRFIITTQPAKGSLETFEDGRFVYTPSDGKRGRDYFGYRAVDSHGNQSQEATVLLRIEKMRGAFRYADTAGLGCEYAALQLTQEGVFTGSRLGEQYLFEPERIVSRGEFLSLCMSLVGAETLAGGTGYADDGDIPDWLRPYVAAAAVSGYGCARSDSGSFRADDGVTVEDAAAMLGGILSVTHTVLPTEGERGQAVEDLVACGLLEEDCRPEATLNRGETALLLMRALALLQTRQQR